MAPARARPRSKKADPNMEHVSPNFRSSFGSSYMNNRHARHSRVDSIASSVTTPSIASPPEGAPFGAVTVPNLAPGEQIVVINPHTRTYQACEECRRRKIKCDMGPVDNPHSPPCARCRRENKECNFNATRRKIPQKRKKEDLIDPLIQKRHRPMDVPTVDKDDENHTISILHHHKIETPLDSLQMLAVAAHGQFNMPAPSVARISVSTAQLQAWERLQFVRRGWFTAKEGVAYIEYFWNNLYPLTPITLPNYNLPDEQISLLENEAFLLVVLLTISSRYMKLVGPGASSRQSAIHDKLWAHLRGMVERTVWAQEQFGGGVFGAGQSQDPRAVVGLRSLGSIEGLLLLTEWHPRALHFPPSNDDELMAPAPGTGERDAGDSDNESTLLLNGTGGQPGRDSWLEPCWRSDRMCWMLLSNAMSLAFEIGIFDDDALLDGQVDYLQMRKAHLREVLPIYFVQLSGRLDLIGRLPRGYLDAIWPDAPTLSKPLPDFGLVNGSAPPLAPKQDVLYFWKTLTVIMKSGNQKLFLNRQVTQNVIMDDHYITILKDQLEPLLSNWQTEFQECESAIHPLMRSILTIEFEYTRVYLHSLVLQAVIERFTNKSPLQDMQDHKNGIKSGMSRTYINNDDRVQIVQVIDGCRNVLKVVMDDLLPGEFLKHCSVRTYFRIIAVAVILIKTFAIGSFENDMMVSMDLLERSVTALRSCIVDDIHVGNRFADMCEILLRHIRSRLVRMKNGNISSSRAETPGPMNPTSLPSIANAAGSNGPSDLNGPNFFLDAGMYDPQSHEVMPPPGGFQGGFQYDPLDDGVAEYSLLDGPLDIAEDWITLPLNPLNTLLGGADINTTNMGPDVNGVDMLDVILAKSGGMA